MFITIIGGAMFLGCQAWEWTNLIAAEGVTIYNNPFSSALDNGEYITLAEAKKFITKRVKRLYPLHLYALLAI